MAEARKRGGRRGAPKDEEEFGNAGKAHDGEPNGGTPEGGMSAEDDALARKRREKAEAEAAKAAASDAQAAGGDALADKDVDDEPQEELFPLGTLEGDPKKTLKNLIRGGLPIEYTASLRAAEVPLRGGLMDPDESGSCIVAYSTAQIEVVPKRDKSDNVIGWKVRQVFRPTYVEPVATANPEAAAG